VGCADRSAYDLTQHTKATGVRLAIELEQSIKEKTAEIRKMYKIKLPDAIIAATALVYNLTLITRNVNDFKKIDGLRIIDPYNL
jgi:predicted nucleic acid-binding protein